GKWSVPTETSESSSSRGGADGVCAAEVVRKFCPPQPSSRNATAISMTRRRLARESRELTRMENVEQLSRIVLNDCFIRVNSRDPLAKFVFGIAFCSRETGVIWHHVYHTTKIH